MTSAAVTGTPKAMLTPFEWRRSHVLLGAAAGNPSSTSRNAGSVSTSWSSSSIGVSGGCNVRYAGRQILPSIASSPQAAGVRFRERELVLTHDQR